MPARWLLGGLILLVREGSGSSALLLSSRRNGQEPTPPGLDAAVVALHSLELEKSVAREASEEAQATATTVVVAQKAAVAELARQAAEEDFEDAAHVVPAADAIVKEARAFAAEARRHADHTIAMAEAIRKLPMEAAENAVRLVEDNIRNSARNASELAKNLPPESNAEEKKQHLQQIARAVAEAYEPYQLGLLRAQKSMEVAYAKATSAANGVQDLVTQAHQMASTAQKLQEAGQGISAQQMMTDAHAIMQKAKNMKAWAGKFYTKADEINSSLSRYQLAGEAAAAQAARELGPPVTPEPDPERALVGLTTS